MLLRSITLLYYYNTYNHLKFDQTIPCTVYIMY